MTYKEYGLYLRVPTQAVRRWYARQSIPPKHIYKISKLLNISYEELEDSPHKFFDSIDRRTYKKQKT